VTVLGREQAIAGTYIGEVSRLSIGDLRATWTSLATSSAQHTSILFGFTFPNDPSAQVQTAVVRGL
jgi:hypothetical protein